MRVELVSTASQSAPSPEVQWHAFAKRAFDVVLGTVAAALALPVIFFLAVAVAVTLRCWPFFVHERIGRDGEPFMFPKIRTLPPTIPRYTDKFSFDRARLPALCRFLRSTHLDELPQLVLVPMGRMSLVGPRPKMPDEFEPIDWTYGKVRTSIRQGCTGLWQIGAHAHLEVRQSPEYDFFYVQHASARLDLWILWRTIRHILGVGRPVTLDQVPRWTLSSGYFAWDADEYIDLVAAHREREPDSTFPQTDHATEVPCSESGVPFEGPLDPFVIVSSR